jgi:nucleotide-binding universal stress UspA family protein
VKILIGVDDSVFSEAAVEAVARRKYDPGTQVRLVSAVEPVYLGFEKAQETNLYARAREAVDRAVRVLRDGETSFEITTEIIEGSAKQVIVEEAERWGADLVVVGSHGRRGMQRFLLGSVSQAVAMHAPCSVEIVRLAQPKAG